MQVVFYVFMFIFGSCLGSFLCCQARRLRLREKGKKPLGSRSVCPSCKHKLKWYENLPIISWTLQKGKCRKCGKKIGIAEILSELLTGLAFLGLAISFFPTESTLLNTIPLDWTIFVSVLLLTLNLIFLAIYDGLYGELPSLCLIISAIFALIIVILNLWSSFSTSGIFGISDAAELAEIFPWQSILNPLYAILVLGGTYLILYLISKGKWVGDGDWILGAIIAAALGTPWLALIALFIANFSACLIMFPIVSKNKNHTIYFGPFLTLAFILTLIISNYT